MATDSLTFTDSSGLAILDNTTVSRSFDNIAPSIWGRILDIGVLLQGLSHTFPDDLDFLLVGGGGRGLEFWSDAGGSVNIANGNFLIADFGASLLPDATAIAPGTYRPTDYSPSGAEFASNWGLSPSTGVSIPAPTAGATLHSIFDGSWLNSTWSLFVRDDAAGDTGSLGLWGFHITYQIIVKPDDFNGNHRSDILWQNDNGTPAIWLMNGLNPAGAAAVGGPIRGRAGTSRTIGDFNNDGRADILWQNDNGTPAIWLMNGMNPIGCSRGRPSNPGPSWHIEATGDFNFDGKSDILWQNDNGTPAIWLMNGTNRSVQPRSASNPGPTWHVEGSGDFNNDGRSDILWQNDDGTPAIWLMNGMNVIGAAVVGSNPGPTWHVEDTGDFNNDGRADILWQNDDGTPAIWLMNGLNVIGAAALPNPGPTWHVEGTGDYNGDGNSDILWQHDSGLPAIWDMNGTNVIGAAVVNHPIRERTGTLSSDRTGCGSRARRSPV